MQKDLKTAQTEETSRFYRAVLNAGRSSREKGVRLSVCVCLSVRQTKRKILSRFLYRINDYLA